MVFDTVAVDKAASISVGGSQSQRWNVHPDAFTNGAGSNKAGASTVTMSWTWAGAQNWSIGGVSIKPADDGITLDVTHTVSGTNLLLMVGISAWATFPTVSSVVWDPAGANQALTLVGSQANSTVAKMWMYSLVAPTIGTKILRVTFAATTTAVVGVMSFTGVSQAIPYSAFRSGADSGSPSDPTHLIVPSATGELVFETIAVESYQSLTIDNSPPWSTTNTQRWNMPILSVGDGAGSTATGGAPSQQMGWHNTSDNAYAEGAVSIKPVNDPVGADIIFRALDPTTCNDGNAVCTLDHEIESYDPVNGTLVAWVRIPALKAAGYTTPAPLDTLIYIYYGSTTNTLSTENPTGVWDANFKGVWHLKEATGAANFDSTANGNNRTPAGSPTQGAGKINGSLTFASASSQNVDAADVDTVDGIAAMTVDGWV